MFLQLFSIVFARVSLWFNGYVMTAGLYFWLLGSRCVVPCLSGSWKFFRLRLYDLPCHIVQLLQSLLFPIIFLPFCQPTLTA